jgi:hypothetical protein
MDVLEHNPVTFLMSKIELLRSNNILSLTKGNLMKLFDWINATRASKSFNILDWVGSG